MNMFIYCADYHIFKWLFFKVCMDKLLLDAFSIQNGQNQLLFNFALGYALRKMQEKQEI